MTKISADIDKLAQAKRLLTIARKDLVETKGCLIKCLNDIYGKWEGAAAESFRSRLNGHIKEINNCINTIDQLTRYVDLNTSYMKVLDALLKKVDSIQASIESDMSKMNMEDAVKNGDKN